MFQLFANRPKTTWAIQDNYKHVVLVNESILMDREESPLTNHIGFKVKGHYHIDLYT